jgi:hypothetical protein
MTQAGLLEFARGPALWFSLLVLCVEAKGPAEGPRHFNRYAA